MPCRPDTAFLADANARNSLLRRNVALAVLGCVSALALSDPAMAQDSADTGLQVELNTLTPQDAACRVTFLTRNLTGIDIGQAIFETVVFDAQGRVALLTLFDFQDLPDGRPRVRQFDLPGLPCDSVGQVLINGVHRCTVDEVENSVCQDALMLTSRTGVELSG